MNLRKCFATNNKCYKNAKKMTVKGIMVHSTGANNPNLKRYVQPDDGLLGVNPNGNHFNTLNPGGRKVCVHAFVGKLKDGSIATYQIMPWNWVAWHSGGGSNGYAYNMGYIGFEICEDGLTDRTYFNKVYQEAVELCIYLCKQYGLTEKDIICHSEGHKMGIASNHGDVMHWFPKHGKSMDTFRAAVKVGLTGTAQKSTESAVKPTATNAEKIIVEPAKSIHKAYSKAWTVNAKSGLNMRVGAGTNKDIIKTLPNGSRVRCYGYYTNNSGTIWLYVVDDSGTKGYVSKTYLK